MAAGMNANAAASAGTLTLPKRSHAIVRAVAAQWRLLTSPARSRSRGPGLPVLVACSGGADSSALCIALAASRASFAIAHVVHDMRPPTEASRDRDIAESLARALGVPFCVASVSVRDRKGNAEHNARHARYHALASLAREHGFAFIATAHHAHDNLESLLIAMARGGGVRAMAGIRPRLRTRPRVSGHAITIIRPMLTLTPAQARELCTVAGWTWAEDATNADRSGDRIRSALRHRVLPELLLILPDAALGSVRSAKLAGAAMVMIERALADEHFQEVMLVASGERQFVAPRARVRQLSAFAIGEVVRAVVKRAGVPRGPRSLSQRSLESIATLIRSDDTDPREFQLRGLEVIVSAHQVLIRRRVAESSDNLSP